jgi:hypothetical protein
MIPKRKFIKKQYVAPPPNQNEQLHMLPMTDLIEQLKAEDPKVKGDAMATIANLRDISPEF